MKRQGMRITTGQLYRLIEDLEKAHTKWEGYAGYFNEEQEFQINIINKTPECSDTWVIESHRKKVGTVLGKPLGTQKKAGEDTNSDMPVDLDNHDDTPQDCSGQANVAAKEDTNNSVLPADFLYKCGHNQKWTNTFVKGDAHRKMMLWVHSVGYKGDKTKCWDCYCKDSETK